MSASRCWARLESGVLGVPDTPRPERPCFAGIGRDMTQPLETRGETAKASRGRSPARILVVDDDRSCGVRSAVRSSSKATRSSSPRTARGAGAVRRRQTSRTSSSSTSSCRTSTVSRPAARFGQEPRADSDADRPPARRRPSRGPRRRRRRLPRQAVRRRRADARSGRCSGERHPTRTCSGTRISSSIASSGASRGGRQFELTRIEFALLELLMTHPHRSSLAR